MTDVLSAELRGFLQDHRWGVLAVARPGRAPHQSMVGYTTDGEGRIVVSTKAYTAKWRAVVEHPEVSFTVVEGRAHLVVEGEAETIESDPLRAALSGDVFARLTDAERPDPASLVDMLDEQQRTVIRITPGKARFHD